jgi:hypothetical protein
VVHAYYYFLDISTALCPTKNPISKGYARLNVIISGGEKKNIYVSLADVLRVEHNGKAGDDVKIVRSRDIKGKNIRVERPEVKYNLKYYLTVGPVLVLSARHLRYR